MQFNGYVTLFLVLFIIIIIVLVAWIAVSFSNENQCTITKKVNIDNCERNLSNKENIKIKSIKFSVTGNFIKKNKNGKIANLSDLDQISNFVYNLLSDKIIIQQSELLVNNDNNKYFIMKKAPTIENISYELFKRIKKECKKIKVKLIDVKIFDNKGNKYSYFRYHPSHFML